MKNKIENVKNKIETLNYLQTLNNFAQNNSISLKNLDENSNQYFQNYKKLIFQSNYQPNNIDTEIYSLLNNLKNINLLSSKSEVDIFNKLAFTTTCDFVITRFKELNVSISNSLLNNNIGNINYISMLNQSNYEPDDNKIDFEKTATINQSMQKEYSSDTMGEHVIILPNDEQFEDDYISKLNIENNIENNKKEQKNSSINREKTSLLKKLPPLEIIDERNEKSSTFNYSNIDSSSSSIKGEMVESYQNFTFGKNINSEQEYSFHNESLTNFDNKNSTIKSFSSEKPHGLPYKNDDSDDSVDVSVFLYKAFIDDLTKSNSTPKSTKDSSILQNENKITVKNIKLRKNDDNLEFKYRSLIHAVKNGTIANDKKTINDYLDYFKALYYNKHYNRDLFLKDLVNDNKNFSYKENPLITAIKQHFNLEYFVKNNYNEIESSCTNEDLAKLLEEKSFDKNQINEQIYEKIDNIFGKLFEKKNTPTKDIKNQHLNNKIITIKR